MVAATREIEMVDLSRRQRLRAQVDQGMLTSRHTVGQAVEYYLGQMGIRQSSSRWVAISRGVKLDKKQTIEEIPTTHNQWTVMPEVTAG